MHAVRNRKLTNKRVSYCNHLFSHYFDAGIKPGFSYINICMVALSKMLKAEGDARGFQLFPKYLKMHQKILFNRKNCINSMIYSLTSEKKNHENMINLF